MEIANITGTEFHHQKYTYTKIVEVAAIVVGAVVTLGIQTVAAPAQRCCCSFAGTAGRLASVRLFLTFRLAVVLQRRG